MVIITQETIMVTGTGADTTGITTEGRVMVTVIQGADIMVTVTVRETLEVVETVSLVKHHPYTTIFSSFISKSVLFPFFDKH